MRLNIKKSVFTCFLLAFCNSFAVSADKTNIGKVQSPESSVATEVLLSASTSWDGKKYAPYATGEPLLSLLKITIPPHTELPWHTHPMASVTYLLSGEITLEKKTSGERKILKVGEAMPEMVDDYHRGITTDQPAILLVYYAGVKGQPLTKH